MQTSPGSIVVLIQVNIILISTTANYDGPTDLHSTCPSELDFGGRLNTIGRGIVIMMFFALAPQVLKIRSCFSDADESKMLNCVSASAKAPDNGASIKRNHNTQTDNGIGRCCQYRFFELKLSIQANSVHRRICPKPDFFKGRFQLDNRHRLGKHPHRAQRNHQR